MKSMCQDARRNSPSVAERSPTVFLLRHGLADRLVLDAAQLGVVDTAVCVIVAGLQEALRTQQAPDVVGSERRSGLVWHGASFLELVERGSAFALQANVETEPVPVPLRDLRRVVGSVAVEVHARDDGLEQPASEDEQLEAASSLRDEERESALTSVGQRPNPCAGSQSSSSASSIGTLSPSSTCPARRTVPPGSSCCSPRASPRARYGPTVCDGVLMIRSGSSGARRPSGRRAPTRARWSRGRSGRRAAGAPRGRAPS